MTDEQPAAPGQPGFARGNERLDQMLADPQLAADVAAAHADAEEMDRVNAMNLAMIRKAAQMTQVEVARKLTGSQVRRGKDRYVSRFVERTSSAALPGGGPEVVTDSDGRFDETPRGSRSASSRRIARAMALARPACSGSESRMVERTVETLAVGAEGHLLQD